MMKYGEFKKYVSEKIKDYLPEEYKDAEVCMTRVEKLDDSYLGMMLKQKHKVSAPVINLKLFFKQYEEEASLEELMQQMARTITTNQLMMDEASLEDYEKVKQNLFFRLSPIRRAEAIMQESPHKVIGDLLLTYHVYIPMGSDGFYSTRITYQLMESFGVTEAELHQDALMNTPKLFPPKIQSLVELVTGEKEADPTFMVVTNTDGIYGASVLFYEGMMDEITELIKGSFYAIPSSVHEWLIMPDGRLTATELAQMVRDANDTVVRLKDLLSYSVYYYDAETKQFTVAETAEEKITA